MENRSRQNAATPALVDSDSTTRKTSTTNGTTSTRTSSVRHRIQTVFRRLSTCSCRLEVNAEDVDEPVANPSQISSVSDMDPDMPVANRMWGTRRISSYLLNVIVPHSISVAGLFGGLYALYRIFYTDEPRECEVITWRRVPE